ncbi:MAG TPA: hypothetical protein VIG99_03575 [Myxococcaceae bacterium]
MSQDKLRDRLVEAARQRRAREEAARPELDALPPLDAEAKNRISARVMREMGAAPPAAVIPLRRRWQTVAGVGVAAMAAALVLLIRPPRLAPLPTYEATFSGDLSMRGTGPQEVPARVGPGSVLTLTARPQRPVQGPVVVESFLVRGDTPRPWQVPWQISAEGAVRLSGPAQELLPQEPGPIPWTAVIVIKRPGRFTSVEDALRFTRGAAPADPDMQVIQVRFEQTGP